MDPAKDPRGFFEALFDLSFSRFITTQMIRLLFILGLVVIAVSYVSAVVAAFAAHVSTGLLVMFILGPVMAFVQIVFLRVALELVIVAFRTMEAAREIARNTRDGD
ncbi:MAG: DUF4282 domain-containing protein [Opitutales bacterium]|nr:DUF4282 domain-containing protein [Opitutales bacterium]